MTACLQIGDMFQPALTERRLIDGTFPLAPMDDPGVLLRGVFCDGSENGCLLPVVKRGDGCREVNGVADTGASGGGGGENVFVIVVLSSKIVVVPIFVNVLGGGVRGDG